jgi:hypothetical protein
VRGRPLNRCARLSDAAAGGQILASHATIELVGDDLADQASVTDLGQRHLRGVTRPERAHLIQARTSVVGPAAAGVEARPPGPPESFPTPLLRAARRNLIGRGDELERIAGRHDKPQENAGVVVIAGEPGVGKTRLAAAAAPASPPSRRAGLIRPLRRGPARPLPALR